MGPAKLGRDFKTIKVKCSEGHEVARYRKPRQEWGHRTHKLWLVAERINNLATEPPIWVEGSDGDRVLDIPELGTPIRCGNPECSLEIGQIAMVKGTVAIELNPRGLQPTKG